MNKVKDINERTLENEKKSFTSFCKTAEVIMTIFLIFMLILSGIIFITTLAANILKNGALNFDLTGKYTTFEGIFGNLYIYILCVGMAVAFNFGRNIFRELKNGETPFRYEIADKIKAVAMVVFVTGTIDFIMEIIMAILEVNGFWSGDVTIDFELFVWSAILSAVAYIFNYGCKLQQESDETL